MLSKSDDMYGDDDEDDDEGEFGGYKINRKKGIGDMIDLDHLEGQVNMSSIKKIGEIIEKHPDEAVAIMRSWIHTE
ncbi:MAG: hypothetical protein NWS47_01600 [Alphaproteobacteria bacterium]|nr:hypothetical protein [Alphaproteobacteria bacterium]